MFAPGNDHCDRRSCGAAIEQRREASLDRRCRFRRELLRDDGVVWLNLGDSYANVGLGDPTKVGGFQGKFIRENETFYPSKKRILPDKIKPKDLLGIPWAVVPLSPRTRGGRST